MNSTETLIAKAKAQLDVDGVSVTTPAAPYTRGLTEASAAISDIREFNLLIEDHVVPWANITATDTGHIKVHTDKADYTYTPRLSFLSQLANRTNMRTPLDRASGVFLDTLRKVDATVWADVVNLCLTQLGKVSSRSPNVKIRCLKAHPSGKFGCSVPTVRALVSERYSDNNSHLWLISSLQKLAPTGKIARFHFDGDSMHGFWFIPELVRKDENHELGAGMAFRQGEIANLACSVEPAVLLGSYGCAFGSIVGERYVMRHNSIFDPVADFSNLNASVDAQIPLITTAMNKLLATKTTRINRAKAKNYIGYLTKTFHIDVMLAQEWYAEFTAEDHGAHLYALLSALIDAIGKRKDEAFALKHSDLIQEILRLNWTDAARLAEALSDETCDEILTK